MRNLPRPSLHLIATAALVVAFAPARADEILSTAIASSHRTPALVQRDGARHPAAELEFFGIRPDATVVEISPGAGYWTEILAPYLRDSGKLYVAQVPLEAVKGRAGYEEAYRSFESKLAASPAIYGKVTVTAFAKGSYDIAPPGSADFVLTFRNVHNWLADGYADAAFDAFYRALKPGGILGLEGHRGRADRPQDPKAADGYVREDFALELARRAGFELVGKSDIGANPKDTKDYPEGVWTLPPTLRLGEKDREKYVAIGDSDNFVLKFRKPR